MKGAVKFFKFWLPVAAWAVLIFYLSGMPDLKTGFEFDFILRKILHVLEYLILVWLLYRAFAGTFDKIAATRLFIYPAALTFLYAVSDELHQSFVPGRNCSIQDILIDTIGVFIFYINIFLFLKKRRIAI